jgi:hypothetical protein
MNILVLGAGSAGWLAASYLSKTNNVEIRYPKNSSPIGVGESTIPGLIDFLYYCGIDESEIIKKCDGIKKTSIKHHNWHNYDWFHPFPNGMYAYHLNALKLVELIEEKTVDRLTKVDKPDLIIDCTGFNSEFTKNKTFKSYHNLSNNFAIVGPGVTKKTGVTKTFAMDYGWMFNVDLSNRSGNGYIFNNEFIEIDDAISEFMSKNIGNVKEKDLKVIPMKNRYCLEPWTDNVVSVGLSCGFVEPIEATGLFLITWAVEAIDKLKNNPKRSEIFNKSYVKVCQHVYDFLDVFFSTSKNNHTEYWKNIKKVEKISQPKHRLNFFRTNYSYEILSKASGINVS